jgi:hypothetical protein
MHARARGYLIKKEKKNESNLLIIFFGVGTFVLFFHASTYYYIS